jgi:hypothetical protein
MWKLINFWFYGRFNDYYGFRITYKVVKGISFDDLFLNYPRKFLQFFFPYFLKYQKTNLFPNFLNFLNFFNFLYFRIFLNSLNSLSFLFLNKYFLYHLIILLINLGEQYFQVSVKQFLEFGWNSVFYFTLHPKLVWIYHVDFSIST